jgi:hypothetical protein
MPIGISRLVLTTSVIRRVFGEAEIGLDVFDPLITQSGDFLQLNQSDQLIILQQDFDTVGDIFITQAGDELVTQDNRTIITQRES